MYSFGERLRELRIEAGFTQFKLGELVGLTKQAIYRMEKDKNKYSDNELIKRLAFYLTCTPDYLLGLTNEKNGAQANKIKAVVFDPDFEIKKQMEKLCINNLEFAKLVLECEQKLGKKDMSRLKKILKVVLEE